MSSLVNSFWGVDKSWDIVNLDFANTDGSFDAGITGGNGIFWKPDGTEMYMSHFSDIIKQWSCSTPWDLSTATITYTYTATATVQSLSIRESDGKKLYSAGATAIREYDLSTGWDLSTASLNQSFTLPTYMTGLYIKQDGTTFYCTNQTTEDLYEYDMSTPWDVSTTSLTYNFDIGAIVVNAQAIFFKPDGTRFFVSKGDLTRQWDLSTPWDLSTYSLDAGTTTGAIGHNGMYWKPDGMVHFAAVTTTTQSIRETPIM